LLALAGDGLAVVRADGTELRRITRPECTPRPCSDEAPVWSPDGSTLLYVREGTPDGVHLVTWIRAVAADGTGDRLVTGGTEEYVFAPAWSPDGRAFAYLDGLALSNAQTLVVRDFPSGRELRLANAVWFRWLGDGRIVWRDARSRLFVALPGAAPGRIGRAGE